MTVSIRIDRRSVLAAGASLVIGLSSASTSHAASASELASNARLALDALYAQNPKARELGAKARAILVFPAITKAGFMLGGMSGNGAMLQGGRAVGFYNISAASFGFQAGAQRYGYALFFITESALDYLNKSKGWAIGSGPSVVVIDEGFAKTMNSTTLSQDVYAMAFNQKGLMGGMGLEGSKITPIHPDP